MRDAQESRAPNRPWQSGAWLALIGSVLLLPPSAAQAASSGSFSPERAAFALRVRGELVPYRVFGVFVLPGEELHLEVAEPHPPGPFLLQAAQGEVVSRRTNRWTWRAPGATGLYPLTLAHPASGEATRLNVFVMVPYSRLRNGRLNGYRMGVYPEKALRGLDVYRPPQGFIEVTRENLETRVSPHFTLGQFLCKQASPFPKYMALREQLLLKLEVLLEAVNDRGFRTDSFFVMSGFRTPAYNTSLGNVRYSRHQWGGAADIFIDESPRDGVMDDLNRDGRIDAADADVLYDLFDGLARRRGYDLVGGLGRYGSTPNHGPFVHVDARGFRARWGK